MLGELTPAQRQAVPRIVSTLADGGTLTSLLTGTGKICAWKTYYQKPKGWSHNERFRAALERAQQEYDQYRLSQAVDIAVDRMRRTTPLAAELAERVLIGVLRGNEGDDACPPPVAALLDLMTRADTDKVKREAAAALVSDGLRAAFAVLDRADIKTAMKAQDSDASRWEDLLKDLRGEDDGEMADVETEGSDLSAAGVPASPGSAPGSPEPGSGDPVCGGGEVG